VDGSSAYMLSVNIKVSEIRKIVKNAFGNVYLSGGIYGITLLIWNTIAAGITNVTTL
jgi:hypothetical protein